jgi:hypothetical protein
MELKEDNSGHSGDVEEVARSPIVSWTLEFMERPMEGKLPRCVLVFVGF